MWTAPGTRERKKINDSKIYRISLRAVQVKYVISADTFIESCMNFLNEPFYKIDNFITE